MRLAIISGEMSGDALGASLVAALRAKGVTVEISGVGADKLAAAGQHSYFPQSDIAVMGLTAVVQRLPLLLRRIRETAQRLATEKPDLVVTIDSPDFNLRVAKKLRALAPDIPVIHWVCPSVWAWRPKRAIRMRPHVDHILCLLPFEPRELEVLHGPPGTYVGHPLIERTHLLRPQTKEERAQRDDAQTPQVMVLPGSRHSEVSRLLGVFGEAAQRIKADIPGASFLVPTVPHVRAAVRTALEHWPVPATLIEGEADKLAAFRRARAALAASGTVTLELALSGVPTVAAYRVPEWEAMIARRVIRVPSVILPNLILGEKAVPEFLQEDCTASHLAQAMRDVMADGGARAAQRAAFEKLDVIMALDGETPSERAARIVLEFLAQRVRRKGTNPNSQ
ncbi:MAG: lipid-A-disaccharide synthase [Beijerinckiaceae bacterium]